MSATSQELGERFEQHLVIAAPPATVFECFFAPEALRSWWQAVRFVTTPVPFGVYAVEWATTPFRDDLLGPLGGVFHGTVVDVRPGQQFLVADAWWIPPEGDPVGPMALHVHCAADAAGCRLHVRQDGCDPSPRWRRGPRCRVTRLADFADRAEALRRNRAGGTEATASGGI